MARPRRIGVVINLDWTMKHHQEVFAGIQRDAVARGWETVLWPFAPEVIDEQGRKLYDGLIGRVHPELEERATKARIPLVNVWVSSPCADVPAVLPDVEEAGRMAANHLLARGFRRYGYVGYGYGPARSSQLMMKGFREVVRANGCKMNRFLTSSSFSDSQRSWTTFQKNLKEWVRSIEPPIGIASINDKLARYIINAALEHGYRVPEDVAVVGLENEEVVCLDPVPSITSIELGWRQIGEGACELLEKAMTRSKGYREIVRLPPVTLVPRKSTDSFKVDDEYVARALKVIAEQSHRPIKVRDVVEHVPISWRSLERRFHECRGTTISREITRFRVERAKRLLTETDLLVKQIAEASGFANTRRLCEVFKRLEGTSPERYRLERSEAGHGVLADGNSE